MRTEPEVIQKRGELASLLKHLEGAPVTMHWRHLPQIARLRAMIETLDWVQGRRADVG